MRYRLLESIRQYARERLEASGDTAAVRRRHADHYVEVAETAAPHLRSPDQLAWAEALARETDNFRVVLDWALETPSVEHVCRLIAPFTVQGLPIAYLAMDWAQTAIGMPGGEDDPRFVVVAAWAAWGATMGSDLDRAADFIAVAERAQGGSGTPDPLLLRSRAVAAYFGGNVDRAIEEARAWVTVARASEDHFGLADALLFLGVVLRTAEPDGARAAFDEALRVGRADAIPSSLALILSTVAGYLPVDESERAVSLLDEAIDIGNRCGDAMAVYASIMHKGVLAARRGDWRSALAAGADATGTELEMGDVIGLQSTYMLVAAAFSSLGQDEAAAVVIGKVASIESLTSGASYAIDLFAVAEERSRDVLGNQRLASLIDRGAALDHRAAVAYLRTEADRVLDPPVD